MSEFDWVNELPSHPDPRDYGFEAVQDIVDFYEAHEAGQQFAHISLAFHAAVENHRLKEREKHLENEVKIDPLTGLPNRSGFIAEYIQVVSKRPIVSTRKSDQLDPMNDRHTVLFLDLDRFKGVNDTFGHDIGDRALVETADRLRKIFRDEDVIARIGGDEFAGIFKGIGAEEAILIAERIIKATNEIAEIDGLPVSIGASIGLTEVEYGTTIDKAMREADMAMYEAKAKGKNQIQIYGKGSSGV